MMVVSLKQNYHFEDLLLDQAVDADRLGDETLTDALLRKAENAETILRDDFKRLRDQPSCAVTMSEFRAAFEEMAEPVIWSDFGLNAHHNRRKKTRREKLREEQERWLNQDK